MSETTPAPDLSDLTGAIAAALDGAHEAGHSVAVAYVDADGNPKLSYRGSVHVHGPRQIAMWARTPDAGLAAAIARRPRVAMVYLDRDRADPKYLSIEGTARVDPSANERVYAAMAQVERDHDPEALGVAVIVDVDAVSGWGAEIGSFAWPRD